MLHVDFKDVVYESAEELGLAAEERLLDFQAALEDMHGDILLGIEDEFTIHGVDYTEEEALIAFLTERLSAKYGSAFSSIDHEHPLMRVKDSIEAGKNEALHIPDTFRLELVTHHAPEKSDDESHVVRKANMLTQMRMDIWQAVDEFSDSEAVVSWNPRPIENLHDYLRTVSRVPEEEVLDRIKEQAEARLDLIGRERILSAESLDDLLLGDDAPIDNHGAAGSGVHINIGFAGRDGVNPFYNADDPDSGTPVTWNTSAGVIDVTSQSILPFTNLRDSSWRRIGNQNLSASSEACYHPLKKGGAVVKQNPYTPEFFEAHGVPFKETINEKNAHIEIRHCDGGAGLKDGNSLIMLQLCATMAGMYHGLREDKISSYEELMEYRAPLCEDFDDAVEKFQGSQLMQRLFGPRLHAAVLDHTHAPERHFEEAWTASYSDPDLEDDANAPV